MTTFSLTSLDADLTPANDGVIVDKPETDNDIRDGESEKTWFRSKRVFQINDDWFFSTRENINLGPYTNQQDAEMELQTLLTILQKLETPEEAVIAIQEFSSRWKAQIQ